MTLQTLILCASARPGSSTRRAADAVAAALSSAGDVAAEVVEVGDLGLPLCDGGGTQRTTEAVVAWQRRATKADAHVWVSPEWHGSYSGLLKNALDLLDSRALTGRPVGLVAQASGHMGAATTLEHLCSVARNMGGWVAATQVSMHSADIDSMAGPMIERLGRLGKELQLLSTVSSAGVAP